MTSTETHLRVDNNFIRGMCFGVKGSTNGTLIVYGDRLEVFFPFLIPIHLFNSLMCVGDLKLLTLKYLYVRKYISIPKRFLYISLQTGFSIYKALKAYFSQFSY